MVPRLRRAHWERCMAAMCIAEEVSGEAGCRASPGLALAAGLGRGSAAGRPGWLAQLQLQL